MVQLPEGPEMELSMGSERPDSACGLTGWHPSQAETIAEGADDLVTRLSPDDSVDGILDQRPVARIELG